MRKIPLKLRAEMEDDSFYDQCCVTGQKKWQTKIDWHHNLIYAGRQVNEKWCILPLAKAVHDQANNPEVRKYLDYIMLNRATIEELKRYSKAVDLLEKREKLNEYYAHKENQLVL